MSMTVELSSNGIVVTLYDLIEIIRLGPASQD